MTMNTWTTRVVSALLVIVFVAGCGSDDGDDAALEADTDTTVNSESDSEETEETDDSAATAADDEASDDESADDAASDMPVAIRMGWGFPVEEYNYVMIQDPSIAPNNGTCYTVEWTRFNGTGPAIQAVAAGTIDGGTFGGLSTPVAINQGVDLVLTSALFVEAETGFNTTWVANSDFSLDGASGFKVGTNAVGGSLDYLAIAYLAEQGFTAGTDYEIVELPFPQQFEALEAGRIDIAALPMPFFLGAADNPDYQALWNTGDVISPFPQLLQGFSREFADAHPDAVACWVEDMSAVAAWTSDPANREAVIELTSALVDIPAERLGYLLTEADYWRPPDATIDVASLQKTWDFFGELGGLTEVPQVEDHLIDGVSLTR